jgi:hypothetical protein
MAGLVEESATLPEIPWGPHRRMPHGINDIHGGVHFSAGWVLFNDFADGYYHLSDPCFLAEVRRFARQERRELLLVFRQRRSAARDYASFAGFLRSVLPWFSNCNGPQKRVLWGNPAPFPVVNVINGNWSRDVYRLKHPGGPEAVLHPPIRRDVYFREAPYRGRRLGPRWPEKLLALTTYHRLRARGSKGGLFFVDRRKLMAGWLERLKKKGVPDEPLSRL